MRAGYHPPRIAWRGRDNLDNPVDEAKRIEIEQVLVRRGKQELERTIDHAERLGAPQYRRTFQISEYPDREIYIHTTVAGPFTGMEIVVPDIRPVVSEQVKEELIEEKEDDLIYVGIYSGFAWEHDVTNDYTDGPPNESGLFRWIDRLHEFNPTKACRNAYKQDFTNTTYQPITRLNLPISWDMEWWGGDPDYEQGFRDLDEFDGSAGQTNLIHPCNYSGPMARAVSLALGNGTFNLLSPEDRLSLLPADSHQWFKDDVEDFGYFVQYDNKYDRNHHLTRASDGSWWIVEISEFRGIYARKLPVIKNVFQPEDPDEQKALAEFGGLPSGESFPNSSSQVNGMIDDGTAIRLMSRDDLDEILWDAGEQFFSLTDHWVSNDDGTEFRAVTYNYNTSGWMTCQYWKLTFTINGPKFGGVYVGSAKFEMLNDDVIDDNNRIICRAAEWNPVTSSRTNVSSFAPGFPMSFQLIENGDDWYVPNLPGYKSDWDTVIPDEIDVPVWVGWINKEWHTVHFRNPKIIEHTLSRVYSKDLVKNNPEYIGIIPWTNHQLSDFWYRDAVNYSTGFDAETRIPTAFNDHIVNETGQINIYSDTQIWDGGYVYKGSPNLWNYDVYYINWVRRKRWRTEQKDGTYENRTTWFIRAPYHRNAYYVWDEKYWRIGNNIEENYVDYCTWGNPCTHINQVVAICDQAPYGDETALTPHTPPADITWDVAVDGFDEAFDIADWDNHDLGPNPAKSQSCSTPPTTDCEVYIGRHESLDAGFDPGGLQDDGRRIRLGNSLLGLWGILQHPDNGVGGNHWKALCDTITGLGGVEQSIQNLGHGWWIDPTPTIDGYEIDMYLIAEGHFDTGPIFLDSFTDDDDAYNNISAFNPNGALCLTSVLGDKAIIYADITKTEYKPTLGYPWWYPEFHREGTMPDMPNRYEGEEFWLTFVGVNGP